MLTHEYPNTWVVHSTKTYSLASAQASCENAKTQKRENAKTLTKIRRFSYSMGKVSLSSST